MQTVDIGGEQGDTRECVEAVASGQLPVASGNNSKSIRHPELAHDSIEYETPLEFFDVLNRSFGFTLDVCATPANAKCRLYYTVRENGLAQAWAPATCWMNPPYGDDELTRWMAKAHGEAERGATVVCLVPARTHTNWFHNLCAKAEVRFLRGRLRYVGTAGEAPFAQLVVIFRAGLARPWGMRRWEWRPRTKQKLLALSA